jgi:hypothetical protein
MKRKIKRRKREPDKPRESSPVTVLESELRRLRQDLQATARAYVARLESEVRAAAAAVRSSGPVEGLSRERLHQIRDVTIELRKRKLKPEKGRRKDLRKIDSLISDLRSAIGEKS